MNERDEPQIRIDDTEEVRELDFTDHPAGRIGDERSRREVDEEFPPQRSAQMGKTGGETLGASEYEDNVSQDDLTPETMLDPADETPVDSELRVVDEREIGGGIGLDEAELGRSAPLDGEPWTDEVTPTGTDSDKNP